MNKLFEKDIKSWKGVNNKPTCYFNVYYFRKMYNPNKTKKLHIQEEHKNFMFNSLLKDGYTHEQIVKHIYKNKLEKKRLTQKLKELNINNDIKTTTYFPKLNKHGNYTTVYYNGTEIIF
jgi:hypothetical protein